MQFSAFLSLLLVIANVVVSYKGFTNSSFFERYCFDVERILVYKEHRRLVTSGFLHSNWMHLIFNMYTLYIFGGVVENELGSLAFILIYFASLVGGDLFSLYIHRHQSDYQSIGASGAVCGMMFSCIIIFPGMMIRMFPLPIRIYGWLYGLAYILYSIYGIGNKKGNIGHDAHLGGALIGILSTIIIRPSSLVDNYITILVLTIPCLVFIYLIVTRPHLLLQENMFSRKQAPKLTIDEQYNAKRSNSQKEIDFILDKIHRRGLNSLSKTEKEKLEHYSKQNQ